ncbi:nicotinamide riboside transporter PnuC [Horticoccus sp. 23ND18S-11]|uniref:nicotinamide riboside transporter PnuC n=1 Tax=Horticoccus sp. 23ND18S-11 TaxID=3391832 RepID=UPI0039C8ECC0
MSLGEIIGTVLGIVGVVLMIRQHVWTWPVGLVQVAVYAWVFYDAKLYSDAILQICFFAIQAYGWWHWWRGTGTDGAPLRVSRTPARVLFGWGLGGAIVTALWGETIRRTTDAALPHWDAFILVFSLIAQWLQARKQLENWAGWMIVNVVAIGVYWAKDLRLTAGLYVVFLILAVVGHRQWCRTLQPEASHG